MSRPGLSMWGKEGEPMTPQERAEQLYGSLTCTTYRDGYQDPDNDIALIADVLQQTRRAALLEVSRRLLPNAQSAMLDAPCLWCGYNGEGYWQPTTHELTCPWHNVGGRFDRVVALDRLAQEG